jgi:O-antigen ligase
MIGSQNNSYGTPLSLREWLVCIFATLTLVFTAWSLGGYKTWALHLLFAGGLGTFLASVLPMPRSWNGYDQQHGNLKNFKRLLAQPFFWASMCFLVYILTQYLNPSIVQVLGEKSWWVEPMSPPLGANLPSSVATSYEEMNALRTFVIQASAISLACGILVGIQRRKSALIILWSFVASGVTMGFVAILQKLSGTDKILWIIDAINKNSWGTFAYRNQGAAFLMLVLLVSGLLYFFYLRRADLNLKQGGPHFLCFLFIFLLFGSIWLALSRGGIILSSALALAFCLLAFGHHIRGIIKGESLILSAIFLGLFIIGSIFLVQFSDWNTINKRVEHFEHIVTNIDSYNRTLSTKASWNMAQDRLTYGWGAGSFRYVFPIYQKEYDSIWNNYYTKDGWVGRRIYHYAHNDWVQFLAEYGIFGSFIIGALFLSLIIGAYKMFHFSRLAGCLFMIGLILIFVHNFVDFIFSSPSYWAAFWGGLFLVCKLFEIENNRNNLSLESKKLRDKTTNYMNRLEI